MSKQLEVAQLKPWRNNSGVLTGSENADVEVWRDVHHVAGRGDDFVEVLSPSLFHNGVEQSNADLMPNQPIALNPGARIPLLAGIEVTQMLIRPLKLDGNPAAINLKVDVSFPPIFSIATGHLNAWAHAEDLQGAEDQILGLDMPNSLWGCGAFIRVVSKELQAIHARL